MEAFVAFARGESRTKEDTHRARPFPKEKKLKAAFIQTLLLSVFHSTSLFLSLLLQCSLDLSCSVRTETYSQNVSINGLREWKITPFASAFLSALSALHVPSVGLWTVLKYTPLNDAQCFTMLRARVHLIHPVHSSLNIAALLLLIGYYLH